MNFNHNTVTLAGRLTRPPEVRVVSNDRVVANFTIAVNYGKQERDGSWTNHANFFDCAVWGAQAERLAQLDKGTPLFIEGQLQQDRWQGQDGKGQSRIRINAKRVHDLSDHHWPERDEHDGELTSTAPDNDTDANADNDARTDARRAPF
ncbi:MAG: single-stranded DNA-binding protein [Planctomycetota bacterium]